MHRARRAADLNQGWMTLEDEVKANPSPAGKLGAVKDPSQNKLKIKLARVRCRRALR